jgi:hypothetical protein
MQELLVKIVDINNLANMKGIIDNKDINKRNQDKLPELK